MVVPRFGEWNQGGAISPETKEGSFKRYSEEFLRQRQKRHQGANIEEPERRRGLFRLHRRPPARHTSRASTRPGSRAGSRTGSPTQRRSGQRKDYLKGANGVEDRGLFASDSAGTRRLQMLESEVLAKLGQQGLTRDEVLTMLQGVGSHSMGGRGGYATDGCVEGWERGREAKEGGSADGAGVTEAWEGSAGLLGARQSGSRVKKTEPGDIPALLAMMLVMKEQELPRRRMKRSKTLLASQHQMGSPGNAGGVVKGHREIEVVGDKAQRAVYRTKSVMVSRNSPLRSEMTDKGHRSNKVRPCESPPSAGDEPPSHRAPLVHTVTDGVLHGRSVKGGRWSLFGSGSRKPTILPEFGHWLDTKTGRSLKFSGEFRNVREGNLEVLQENAGQEGDEVGHGHDVAHKLSFSVESQYRATIPEGKGGHSIASTSHKAERKANKAGTAPAWSVLLKRRVTFNWVQSKRGPAPSAAAEQSEIG